ncbi:MAG: AAA family ATPase [Candidatus Aenigmatarchaeota archaeon]
MITRVRLKNWKSHLNSELNFSTGTNALLGHMGSGKTTILDSICFAFFGIFPNLQSKKLKLDDILMKKPIEKDRAEVEVSFQIYGSSYTVRRVIEKKKGTTYSEIREGDKLLEAPNAQRVTETVEKILKVNYELFSKVIYSEQNSLDYFLILPRGQRMKKIDELLMIDKFEKARANTVTLSNKITERLLAKQSTVEQTDLDVLQKVIAELKSSLENLVNEKQKLEITYQQIVSDKNKLEKEVTEFKKIKENLEIFKREERGLHSAAQETSIALENLENALRGFDKTSIEISLNTLKKLVSEFESLLDEKRKEYQKLQQQTSKSKAEIEFLRKEKIEKLENQLEEQLKLKKEYERLKKGAGENPEKELDNKKLLIEKFVGEIEVFKNKIQDLQEEINKINSVEGKCPLCGSKLTEEKKKTLINEKRFKIKSLLEKLKNASEKKELNEKDVRELENILKKLDEMTVQIREFDKIKSELDTSKNIFVVLNESTSKLEKELNSLSAELNSLQTKYKESITKKQQFEIALLRLQDYQTKKERLEQLIKQRNEFIRNIEEIESKLTGKNLEVLEKSLKDLIAKEKEIATKASGLEPLIKEKSIRLNDFQQIYNNLIKEKSEIEKLDKLIRQLKIFEKALETTQIQLRQEFITSVNYTMNNIWPTLYPYQDFTGIRLAIEEGDYILQLKSLNNEWVNVEGIASGGERSIAALALRIAFALVLAPHLRIAFLDEPTANLDSKAISELATTLRERIGEFIDQTFIISHDPMLEDAITGHAYRLERDKSKDEPTKVVQLT